MKIETPKPLESIDFKRITDDAKDYIDNLAKKDGCHHEDCDCEHYMFENVMKTVYGKDIFKWINKRL